jgi:hypothetical protein
MKPFLPPRKASCACDEGKTETAQHETDDSEGPTELIAARWNIKETEEGDKDNTGNDSRTKTVADEPTTTLDAPSPSKAVKNCVGLTIKANNSILKLCNTLETIQNLIRAEVIIK